MSDNFELKVLKRKTCFSLFLFGFAPLKKMQILKKRMKPKTEDNEK